MDQPGEMNTLSGILEKLRARKQDNEFRWTRQGFTMGSGKFYQPEELKIIKTYRFEGDSNPEDSSILYLIETNDGTIGYNIDAYGIYTNYEDEGEYNNFIRKIEMEDRDDQLIFEM